MLSFGGEVKPSVPCRRFVPKWRGSRHLDKITGTFSPTTFHLLLLGSLTSLRAWRHLTPEMGISYGPQWRRRRRHEAQQYTENTLMVFNSNNAYTNAPQCYKYVTYILSCIRWTFCLQSLCADPYPTDAPSLCFWKKLYKKCVNQSHYRPAVA